MSLSKGDKNREIFFKNVFKILDQDETESAIGTNPANLNKPGTSLEPVNLSFNVYQGYQDSIESLKKKTQTLSNSKSKFNLSHSYVDTDTNIAGRATNLRKPLHSQNKRSVPPLYSTSLKKN